MSQDAIERIAFELECIRTILERYFVVPVVPSPPERKLGKEAISYLDESQVLELEEEELRQISRGLIPSDQND